MNKENLNKFIDDVKDAFEKAIGTSSSVDQERDERTVETTSDNLVMLTHHQ